MDHEDVSKLRRAAKRNANEELMGDRVSDGDADEEGVVQEPKGVQLFDFDAYGRKIGKQKLRRDRMPKALDPMDRRRMWESSFFINSFMNLENKDQYFFYSITFGHVIKKREIRGSLRRRFLFTPGYRLGPGEYRPLAAPLVVWPLKVFLLPYNQLHNFCITVEQWKISDFSFNSLYASARLTLKEIIDLEPEFQLLLKRKLPGRKRSYEVHKMRVSLQLNEVFDIDMVFDSWWFLPDKTMPNKLRIHPKTLSLNVPVQGRSQRRANTTTRISKSNYWSFAGFFSFRGTLPSLGNQYIVVSVACQFESRWLRPPLQLGVCILSLKSVTTYPLFRGVVKKLTTNPRKFQQGEIIGNIRCFIRSVGILGHEDVPFRPMQTVSGTALVTQLNLKEQYLVVRVFKCDNLPVANADSFSSNPMVKVKWDGMVNSGAPRENTLRPVFNQSFYFPVRLLDPRERTKVLFRKYTLPLDLFTKGALSFEVWDSDDTTSDFLGGTDISLHLLWKEGQRETRSLAVGGEESDEKTRLPDGRPAEFANRDGSDYSGFGDTALGEEERVVVPPYEWPYETLVLKRVLELKGSTLPQPSGERSLLWCEVFFIPPMPEDVEMPPQPVVKNSNDIWMQVERRWNKDFRRWQKMYLQWFPEAPKERRFVTVAEHSQSRLIFPLPSFVVPIAVPAQLAVEGELLHWLSNIAYLFSPKQLREGEFPRWQSPASFLTTRRGGVNDHAVLLCSCLLGLEYDAYVCKGTVDGCTTDHAWVMTRHAGGWIMFWEPTNRKRLCLPCRWGYPPQGPPETFKPKESVEEAAEKYWEGTYLEEWFAWIECQAAAAADAARMAAEGATIPDTEIWGEDAAPDETLDPEAVVMEEGGILGEAKGPSKTKRVVQKVDKAEMRKIMQEQLDKLPITPFKDLLMPDSTLSYVPYSSIEVVFNNYQLWGNLQNLHPACITYDFEDLWKWRPLLTEPADPIETDIIIATPIRDKKWCVSALIRSQLLADDLVGNVVEHIRMQRIKNGNDVSFEHRDDMLSKLILYLDLLEFRLHLDEAHNPGPPPNHVGWSSFPEEMADVDASAKTDYEFFDAMQASNVPNFEEGMAPDPTIQGALQMMGEGHSQSQGFFETNPPPGEFYDPFAATGEGVYVAPYDAAKLGGQQGGYLHLQSPATPSGPPAYQAPLNPVDAAAAAMVDYLTEQRRKDQEDEKLMKGYMAGGGGSSWMNLMRRGNEDNIAPSGLQFRQAPRNAAEPPSRSCSIKSFKACEHEAGGEGGSQLSDANRSGVAAAGSRARRIRKRDRLKRLQTMLQKAASDGFRLLQGTKKQQREGTDLAESRSFYAGATAAAAVVTSSKGCSADAMPPSTPPLVPNASIPTGRPKGNTIQGGVVVEDMTGPDTSTQLMQRLAEGSQLLAEELNEHIRNLGSSMPSPRKSLVASQIKRRALGPWRRAVEAVRKHRQEKKRQPSSHGRAAGLNGGVGSRVCAGGSYTGSPRDSLVPASSEPSDQRKRAHLRLKEELRRRVYEQMEARAAAHWVDEGVVCAEKNVRSPDDEETQGLMRIFKAGFDSNPPSSHGSYETASEYASSDRDRHSRDSSIATAEASCVYADAATTRNTSTDTAGSGVEAALSSSDGMGRKSKVNSGFKWVAAYETEQKETRAGAARHRRHRDVVLSVATPEESLQQQMKLYERPQLSAPDSSGVASLDESAEEQQRSVHSSSAKFDLEANRAQSFISEKGTLDSLPESDCCERSVADERAYELPWLVSPPVSTLKRRMRRKYGDSSSKAASSCESIAALIESFALPKKAAPSAFANKQLNDKARVFPDEADTAPSPVEAEGPSVLTQKDAEEGPDAASLMATGNSKNGISERMQQVYASCLQRAKNSLPSGKAYCRALSLSAPAFKRSITLPKAGADSSQCSAASLVGAAAIPRAEATRSEREGSNFSSSSSVTLENAGSDATASTPMDPVSTGATAVSALSVAATSSAPAAPHSSATEGVPAPSSLRATGAAPTRRGPLFTACKDHEMMLDIDYDQPSPEGMIYNPLTGTNEYDYAPYGNMPFGATLQVAGPVNAIPLNQGRVESGHREGAFRVNPSTGQKEFVDGGGQDRARMFGATDFIDSGASARPNFKADGRPEGFNMAYARQKYEAGVPAGTEPVMAGGRMDVNYAQELDQGFQGLDPYGELLEPPKVLPKEYVEFDGGVDLARMGLATGGQRSKVIRKKEPTDVSALQEPDDGSGPTEASFCKCIPWFAHASPWRATMPPEESLTGSQEPRVPTEWRMPVSSGTYAAEQVAKWNWYYRMEQVYFLWQQNVFPVKPNHVFCGFPIHLATADTTEIRSYLGGARRFRRLLDMPVENISYVVTGKCFPLMGGVISTWLFFGAQVPLASAQERKSHMKRIKKPPHTKQRKNPAVEAEDGGQVAAARAQAPG
ncbi:C2 domain-containing protein [Cyclospora cayetanensis]|uniref:C2 domain-containing protein n=1 Tax=Cyclospora cayetanensis TaxID=88456 RepID=A0A1D3CVA0_9EIME|nr:C2 domain-containing protein [Cyclospora cayetanensis]